MHQQSLSLNHHTELQVLITMNKNVLSAHLMAIVAGMMPAVGAASTWLTPNKAFNVDVLCSSSYDLYSRMCFTTDVNVTPQPGSDFSGYISNDKKSKRHPFLHLPSLGYDHEKDLRTDSTL